MRRQADRFTLTLPIELFAEGRRQPAILEDLSRSGMFVQLSPPLPVGTKVYVAMTVEGRRVVTTATVTHRLLECDAQPLGRTAGVGIAFREPIEASDQLFAIAVERLVRTLRPAAPPAQLHIVLGDSSTRLLERMSTALAQAGFSVAIATTGMEVLAACFRRAPDVVVVDEGMPLVSGLEVLDTMAQDARLSAIPVIVTSDNPRDISHGFEHAAADFIAKPYTAIEVVARARRLAGSRAATPALLRGTLAEIGLPVLLTMIEQAGLTGRLAVESEAVAWIDVVDGRIVWASTSRRDGDTFATLMTVLGWSHGTFELTSVAGLSAGTTFAMPIVQVLLEHARMADEAARLDSVRA